jgi:hypothetical protein
MPGCKLNVKTTYDPASMIDGKAYGGSTQHIIKLDEKEHEELVVQFNGYTIFINHGSLCTIEQDR